MTEKWPGREEETGSEPDSGVTAPSSLEVTPRLPKVLLYDAQGRPLTRRSTAGFRTTD